jgi:hypothetical protein
MASPTKRKLRKLLRLKRAQTATPPVEEVVVEEVKTPEVKVPKTKTAKKAVKTDD